MCEFYSMQKMLFSYNMTNYVATSETMRQYSVQSGQMNDLVRKISAFLYV